MVGVVNSSGDRVALRIGGNDIEVMLCGVCNVDVWYSDAGVEIEDVDRCDNDVDVVVDVVRKSKISVFYKK